MLLAGRLRNGHERRGRRQEPGRKTGHLRPWLAEAGLFVEISFHYVAHDRGCKLSVLSTLEQGGNHDFRSLSRREAHEPCVILVRRAEGCSFQDFIRR